jgi:hypothetical protein
MTSAASPPAETRARALGCPFPPLRVVRQKWADTSDNV